MEIIEFDRGVSLKKSSPLSALDAGFLAQEAALPPYQIYPACHLFPYGVGHP